MSDHPRNTPGELQLLRKEIEALGDFLSNERLERKEEIDKLRLHVEAMRRTLERSNPAFQHLFENTYAELLQHYDPESSRDLLEDPSSASA